MSSPRCCRAATRNSAPRDDVLPVAHQVAAVAQQPGIARAPRAALRFLRVVSRIWVEVSDIESSVAESFPVRTGTCLLELGAHPARELKVVSAC